MESPHQKSVVDSTKEGTDRGSTLLVATLSAFLTPFMGSAVNIALPSIGREFGMDAVVLSWVATSYLLAAAMFLIPCGRIADIYGRKRIFMYGIATLIFALHIGKIKITPASYPLLLRSMKVAFIVFATLCFGGVFASLARGKIR
ncbi:MAG: MFS transporter [Candidatus Latescibacteria bacterium]|nr:MFS transporter [Candidatus Latescibacterota bacterium]